MTRELKRIIYSAVIDAKGKMASAEVERSVSDASGLDRKVVRQAIRQMVASEELAYTYIYGTSFLEPSFNRPVRISERIVLKPPEKAYQVHPGDIVIDIASGAAFGTGTHPTTCLVLRALDRLFRREAEMLPSGPLAGLDIGTGSGILAIALAHLGVQEVVGNDIDPCAISEARRNVSINNVAEQVYITDRPFEELGTTFSIILANLAAPTLKNLSSAVAKKTVRGGVVIISGFKKDLLMSLTRTYSECGLALVREATERNWACMVLRNE